MERVAQILFVRLFHRKGDKMADISNTEYITVNADGISVGGKPATTYRVARIYNADKVKKYFAWMQEQNPNITEIHIGAFVTPGKYAKPGNPDGIFGPNGWCRVKYKNGNLAEWVFYNTYGAAADCAYSCAYNCASLVRDHASFRSAVFGAANDKQNALTNVLKDTDLSQFIGTHKIGAYEIVVRRSGQNTRG